MLMRTVSQCDSNAPCHSCTSVSARCSKTRKPLQRGPQNKALQRQRERLALEAPSTTTSVVSRLGGSKRVRLSETHGVEVMGSKVFPRHCLPFSLPNRGTRHVKGLIGCTKTSSGSRIVGRWHADSVFTVPRYGQGTMTGRVSIAIPSSETAHDLSLRSRCIFDPRQCEMILELIRIGEWPLELLCRKNYVIPRINDRVYE